ncbi:MAG: condensation domain-containing protein [Treponema sp.]|jgi:NRPS condensation-like uncharacterized protein|nr:condensation domain-containing protein [Treponema sp.]
MNTYTLGDGRLYLRHPNANVCFRAEIKGSFTAADFEEALGRLVRRHPLLKSTVEWEGDRVLINPHKGQPGLEFYERADLASWEDWYKRTDALPVDFERGPLVRFCVIFGSGTREIIVLGHHILADGIGWLRVTQDLLLALDGSLDAGEQAPPLENSLISKTRLGPLEKFVSLLLNAGWWFKSSRFTEKEYTAFFNAYRDSSKPNMQMYSLEAADLSRLLAECKERAVTLTEAVLSAFAVAMQDLDSHFAAKAMRFGMAVNIRQAMKTPVAGCMENYLSAVFSKIKAGDRRETLGAAIERISLKTRKQMKNLQRRYLPVLFLRAINRSLVDTIYFTVYGSYRSFLSKILGKLIGEFADNKGGVWISNLGRHECGGYTNFSLLDFQFIPPVFLSMLLTVGAITVNGCLTIYLRYNETDLANEKVQTIYNRALELLLSTGGGGARFGNVIK